MSQMVHLLSLFALLLAQLCGNYAQQPDQRESTRQGMFVSQQSTEPGIPSRSVVFESRGFVKDCLFRSRIPISTCGADPLIAYWPRLSASPRISLDWLAPGPTLQKHCVKLQI